MKNKVGIIGLGYVGTACEVNFSQLPNTEVFTNDKYKASESLDTVVRKSEVIFVCVPTPMNEDGSCDTSIVEEVVYSIAKRSKKTKKTIVIKSTVPPGTTARLQLEHPGHHVLFNPEFLTENNFIDDFANQDLIVIGESILGPSQPLIDLYDTFQAWQMWDSTLHCTDSTTAEMVKYTLNCYLATKVSFFNEIYKICEAGHANYSDLISIVSEDQRIGATHMQVPGPDGQFGFSKSCFPKDINALAAFARSRDVDSTMLDAAWFKNLQVRENHDWQGLPQVNGNYKTGT